MSAATIIALTAVIAAVISCCGVMIYVGRGMEAQKQLQEGMKILFEKNSRHEDNIARIELEVAKIKTKQEDCHACP